MSVAVRWISISWDSDQLWALSVARLRQSKVGIAFGASQDAKCGLSANDWGVSSAGNSQVLKAQKWATSRAAEVFCCWEVKGVLSYAMNVKKMTVKRR